MSNQKTKFTVMKNLIMAKTGMMQMGGYLERKTAYMTKNPNNTYYRVGYRWDQTDECFKSYPEALRRFKELASNVEFI